MMVEGVSIATSARPTRTRHLWRDEAMRRLIVEEWVSLDGYAVDAEGSLDFFPSSETDRYSDKDQLAFLDSVDTILLGRKTYELFVDYWPNATTDEEIIAERLNTLPKLVFSNTLSEAPWGTCPSARVVRGDAVAEIGRLKAQDGANMVLWGSLSLAQDLIAAGLIDEYHLQLCPTLVGGGRALFPTLPSYASLERVSVRTYDTGVVFLHYEPRREA
jgi:dihydrofolate reductase